jgi:histone arginine demethylase JMJD6
MGPKRSGTSVHTDPLDTSAWNTVIKGRKRWAVFPPSTLKKLVKGNHHYKKGSDDEPIDWFTDVLPKIKDELGPDVKVYDFVQNAGTMNTPTVFRSKSLLPSYVACL